MKATSCSFAIGTFGKTLHRAFKYSIDSMINEFSVDVRGILGAKPVSIMIVGFNP
jgi:hypothetical protein